MIRDICRSWLHCLVRLILSSCKSGAWIFFLKIGKNLTSYSVDVARCQRSGRSSLYEAVNYPLQDTNTKLRVNNAVEKVNISDFDHKKSYLFLDNWCVAMDNRLPGFFVRFVKGARQKTGSECKD